MTETPRGEMPKSPEQTNVITGKEIREGFKRVKTGDVLHITLMDGTTERIAVLGSSYDTRAQKTIDIFGFTEFPSEHEAFDIRFSGGQITQLITGKILTIKTKDIKEAVIEKHLKYFDEIYG